MKIIITKNYRICISLFLFSFFNLQIFANIHFTESFTSPNFPTSTFTDGAFTLSSGLWDTKSVMGLETINAYNSTGQAAKLNRYLEAYITTPAVSSVGTISFYYRNFSDIIGGGSFILQKSVNNGAFTDISTVTFTNATSYTLFSVNINDPSSNIRFRIYCPVDNNPGFLCIDEIVVTDMGQTLAANPSVLNEINYYEGFGPSVSKSFNLFGNNLTGAIGNISVIAPIDYEISSDNSIFSDSLAIAYSSSTLPATPIYVRLISGLSVNTYNLETISVSGGGVAAFNVTCSGSVTVQPLPSINVNNMSLSGFSYVFGSGPSTGQSYSISATNLSNYPGNVIITAPNDYEVSLDYAMYSNSLNIPYSTGVLASTIVYVRLKSGLSVNSYSESIINAAEGDTVLVLCNGIVSAPASPTLSVNTSTIFGFTYYVGLGPSVSQTYTLNGSNLTGYPGSVIVNAPINYEISDDNLTFVSVLNVPYTSSVLASSAIYVRLKTGLSAGTYNSEIITNTGGGASTLNVTCYGNVTVMPSPSLILSAATLTGFTYIIGSGPSASQSYNLSGSNLTGAPDSIAITAPSNYEVSTNNSTFSASVNVAYTSSTLASTLVYVRLKSGLAINTYNSEIITNAGGGATTVNVTCNGSVTSQPPPTLITTPTSLSGFSYIVGSGPSTSQSYNLSGNNLTGTPGNITVTAPADYEVSLNNSTFTASVNVAYTNASLSSTPIFVRLKSGLTVNAYNSEIITNAGGGATTVNVTCNGEVSAVSTTCISEGFSNGTTAPTNWIFTSIGATYATAGNFGAASPSLKFDATSDRVETISVTSATELSFWIKGQTAIGSYLLVEGFNGSSWSQVDNILLTSVTTGTTKIYNSGTAPALVAGYAKFRFTYTKASGNLAFDDVVVTCGSVVFEPECNITEKINVQVFPNPNKGSFEVNISGSRQSQANIQIVNILGKIVYEKEIEFSLNCKLPVQMHLETGIYFIKASVNEKIFTKKILIK